jgi:LDH2 family malate/lactate/ureidoglycolate dehydrogenase
MNQPPSAFIRVPHASLHVFVSRAAQAVGMPADRAELLAELLTANDLRGVHSHGTRQIVGYAHLMRDGRLNPNPRVHVVRETPVSVLMDGDGGLGYFPAYEGTLRAIEKAQAQGIAVMATRNHGHFGAAGIYSRMTLPHGLLSFVTSGHQLHLTPGQAMAHAAGGSPMSFSAPTREEDPLVLDFGTTVELGSPNLEALFRLAPGVVFRCLGLGTICQSWGGFLEGVPVDPARAERQYAGANQGALLVTFRIDLFLPAEQFRREMDEYVRGVRALQPMEGYERAYLPGGVEAVRERDYRRDGVPVGEDHQRQLEALAKELGIGVPWEEPSP